MCDYCGCRNEGPTAELDAEHDQLHQMSLRLRSTLDEGGDATELFADFTRLLTIHAAKEEVGLFPEVRKLAKLDEELDEELDQLVAEHETLHHELGHGPTGGDVRHALTLLGQQHRRRGMGPVPPRHPRPRSGAVGRDHPRPPGRRAGLRRAR